MLSNKSDNTFKRSIFGPRSSIISKEKTRTYTNLESGTIAPYAPGSPESIAALAESNDLLVVRDEGAMEAWIDAAIAAQPQAADDVRGGKDAAIGRLVGAVMKASGGQADAKEVRDRLFTRLRG